MKTLAIAVWLFSAGIAWFAWFPLASFFKSLLPSTEYVWAGHVLIYVLIGWGGGIVIPLVGIIFGLMLFWGVGDNR